MSLRSSHNRRAGRPKPESVPTGEEVARDVRRMKHEQKPSFNYRALSLEMHGMICAKCAREFTAANKRELTVHHIDGNDDNNRAAVCVLRGGPYRNSSSSSSGTGRSFHGQLLRDVLAQCVAQEPHR